MTENKEYTEIINIIENQRWDKLKYLLSNMHAAEVVDIIRILDNDKNRSMVFRLLSRENAAYVFSELDTEEQEKIIVSMSDNELKELMHDMSPDDRTSLFEELPADITKKIFSLMGEKDLNVTRQLLGYPEDSIGRIMTPEYIDVFPEYTVKQTLDYIRKYGKDLRLLKLYML